MRARLRCLRSNSTFVDIAGSLSARGRGLLRRQGAATCPSSRAARRRRSCSHCPRRQRSRRICLRIDLPARQVHVRARDQAPLVAGQRHPLREHVVGVRQQRGAVGPRLVGELARSARRAARGSAAGRRRSACAGTRGTRTARPRRRGRAARAPSASRPRPAGTRGRGTSTTPPRSRTSAGGHGRAARRAARGPGPMPVAGHDPAGARGAARSSARCAGWPPPTAARTMTIAVTLRARTISYLPPAALREEDHAVRVARDLVEGPDHLRLAAAAADASWAPRPTCPSRAARGTPRRGRPAPRCTSTSPSASSTSPCPGFMRRNLIGGL